jgi:hypothetical protein
MHGVVPLFWWERNSKDSVAIYFFFSNLGFPTAEASMFKLREKIASNERSDRHLFMKWKQINERIQE